MSDVPSDSKLCIYFLKLAPWPSNPGLPIQGPNRTALWPDEALRLPSWPPPLTVPRAAAALWRPSDQGAFASQPGPQSGISHAPAGLTRLKSGRLPNFQLAKENIQLQNVRGSLTLGVPWRKWGKVTFFSMQSSAINCARRLSSAPLSFSSSPSRSVVSIRITWGEGTLRGKARGNG